MMITFPAGQGGSEVPELPERHPAVRRRPQQVSHMRHQRLQAHVQGVRRRARQVRMVYNLVEALMHSVVIDLRQCAQMTNYNGN